VNTPTTAVERSRIPWLGLAVLIIAMSCNSTATQNRRQPDLRVAKFQLVDRIKDVCTRQAWNIRCEIPEYTDDQRLTDSLDTYGPYAYTFPAIDLGSRNAPADFASIGGAVAIIYVDTTFGAQLPSTYRALNLVQGPNCVYLKYSAGAWLGFVRASAATGTPCPSVSTDPAVPIPVIAIQSPAFPGPNNVPAVARFHEGVRSVGSGQIPQPLFGVKCADRWCILTPAGSAPLAEPHYGNHPNQRPWAARGWADAQKLAVLNPATPGHVTLGTKRASLIPGPAADFNDSTDYVIGQWYHAATVYFPSAPVHLKYTQRWMFKQGENKIYIRHNGPNDWSARIRKTGGPFCSFLTCWQPLAAVREAHPGVLIPPTARFRWLEDDEGIWVRCADGCCTVSDD
jgi:hypothetical protein